MSMTYRCLDCHQDFTFDYSSLIENFDNIKTEEEKIEEIKKYEETTIPFKFEKNLCIDCLKKIYSKNEGDRSDNEVDESQLKFDENKLNELINNICVEQNKIDIEELEEKEMKTKNILNDAQETLNSNLSKLDIILDELKHINQDEQSSWDVFNSFEKLIYLYAKDNRYNRQTLQNLQKKIKKYSQSNIFTDLFNISFSTKVGSINSCRLQFPTSGNNYDELNAGWGYIVFLTCLLAKKFNFQSKRFSLIPSGSYSRIKDKNMEYLLSYSDLTRTLPNFNKAMTVFLDYFGEFMNYLYSLPIFLKMGGTKGSAKCNFNFVIQDDKINNISIIYDENKPNDWCQCMKFLLAQLKFIVTMALMDENEEYKNILEIANIINPYHKSK